MAEVNSTFRLKIGEVAPGFSLGDPKGKLETLDECAGEQGTLVVFACNHCPFVVHLADAFGQFAKQAAGRGVRTVAIMSNDVDKYPADHPDLMLPFARTHQWDFPYLYDADQAVAKAYGAACTPDFFLLDGDKKLFYTGQFDSSRPSNGKVIDGADLGEALNALTNGEAPPENPFPSSGCNIKWIPGQEPDYFG